MDALAIHPYPVFPIGDRRQRFDEMIGIVSAEASSHGFGRSPIWITELGLPTAGGIDHSHVTAADPSLIVTPGEQATTMAGLYRRASADPRIEAVIFHTLLEPDGRVASRGGYGWVTGSDAGLRAKPVWCAIKVLAKPGVSCSRRL